MAYLSATQRVEALLLAQMVWACLEAGVDDREHEDFKIATGYAKEAMQEAMVGLVEKDRNKIARRCGRVHLEITQPYRHEGGRVDKVGLILYFVMKSVTDCDYLVFGADSPMQKAVDLFLPAIAHAAEVEPLYESAVKQGRKVLEHLQRLGYFPGVPYSA